jgi:hypothetical protein
VPSIAQDLHSLRDARVDDGVICHSIIGILELKKNSSILRICVPTKGAERYSGAQHCKNYIKVRFV